MEEIALIDGHVMQPASSAREAIAPIRKTIKKRENKRLDYEKAQDKALKLQRKPARTAKEDAALAKAEVEVSHAANVSEWSPAAHSCLLSQDPKANNQTGVQHC
jgi:hypothetical protein